MKELAFIILTDMDGHRARIQLETIRVYALGKYPSPIYRETSSGKLVQKQPEYIDCTMLQFDAYHAQPFKETPEEIDKLIEDANTGLIKFKELHKGDIIVLKSPIMLDDFSLKRMSEAAQDLFGDDNKVIIVDSGTDIDILSKPSEEALYECNGEDLPIAGSKELKDRPSMDRPTKKLA
ncbi:hypothetical protein LCGC14_0758190 [marine sediment metagenome]|uniref:Uncharacterized protein n=1 Tax=marine sediment metagenome TaxID=412755 RepID=A0A0F9QLV3_9ZZZZ